MTTPIAVAESYMSCVGAVITVGTDPDIWAATVTDGGLTHTYEVDEMTNNAGGGHYEDVKTVDKWEGDITIAWKTASPPPMKSGDIFPVTIAAPTGGPSVTGNFRFNGFQYPLLNPKAGLKLQGKITSQGLITETIAA